MSLIEESIEQIAQKVDKVRGELIFDDVLRMVYNRVLAVEEKGMRRHGKGKPLFEQPAFTVRESHTGFLTGQAQKKIIEAADWDDDSAPELSDKTIIIHQITELVESISYIVFEIMYLLRKEKRRANGEGRAKKTGEDVPIRDVPAEEDGQEERAEEVQP